MVRQHAGWPAGCYIHGAPVPLGETVGNPANIDRQHVTLASESECLYWETKLGAARVAIEDAIAAVGDRPNTVHGWLIAHHARPAQSS